MTFKNFHDHFCVSVNDPQNSANVFRHAWPLSYASKSGFCAERPTDICCLSCLSVTVNHHHLSFNISITTIAIIIFHVILHQQYQCQKQYHYLYQYRSPLISHFNHSLFWRVLTTHVHCVCSCIRRATLFSVGSLWVSRPSSSGHPHDATRMTPWPCSERPHSFSTLPFPKYRGAASCFHVWGPNRSHQKLEQRKGAKTSESDAPQIAVASTPDELAQSLRLARRFGQRDCLVRDILR